METSIELRRLQDFFDPEDIEWKPVAVSKKTGKALAAAYITNRAIMDRLDDVCGPGNWKNEFNEGPAGGVICGLSVRVPTPDGGHEWVTKWDGAENTDVEAVKGGLSSSMRRAAVQWGIGRYIYRLPSQWIPVDQNGRFTQQPPIPAEFLPPHAISNGAPAAQPTNGKPSGSHRRARRDIDEYRMPRSG